MATQLKDLQFNDYTMKGAKNGYNGANFTLSATDVIGYMSGSGGATFTSLISRAGSSSDDSWYFNGAAKKSDESDVAATVTCYDSNSPTTVLGTYKLLVDGSANVKAEPAIQS